MLFSPHDFRGRHLNFDAPPATKATFDSIRTDLGDYLWPTDAGRRITSSFAEYRSNHFHGGLDISTNGVTGYNVFAARDGYVSRIRIMANGYGKMLYVTHADKYTSTYAHLSTFNDRITAVARKEQLRLGAYPIELELPPGILPVAKGEVIAKTGDTGVGPPHLHFEIRDEHLNPVNPLLCEQYDIEDNLPPRIERIMIAPIDPFSFVQGKSEPMFLSRFLRSKVPDVIHLHGNVGFGIQTTDLSNGTRSRSGVHTLEFYVDDSLIYKMKLDRFPADETKRINQHYDLPSLLDGYGKFQKLYVSPGNTLPIYSPSEELSGVITTSAFSEGRHAYRIVCRDFSGNFRELSGTMLINNIPQLQVHRVAGREVEVSATHGNSIASFIVEGKTLSGARWTRHTLGRERFGKSDSSFTLPVNSEPYHVLKVVAQTVTGKLSPPVFHFKKKPTGGPHYVTLKTSVNSTSVQLYVQSVGFMTEAPIARIREGVREAFVRLTAKDLDEYHGVYVPSADYRGTSRITIEAEINGKPATVSKTIELYPVRKDAAGSFFGGDGDVMIAHDSGAVFETLFLRMGKESRPGGGSIITLDPRDIVLNKGITVSLPAIDVGDERYGLYTRTTGGWVFQTNRPDSGWKSYSTTLTRTLGDVAIMKDNSPPSISRLKITARKKRVYAAFRYADNLSGVDTEALRMYLDGSTVIPEIDGEHNRVWYEGESDLERGKHELRVVVTDRVNNISTISRSFTVR